ncbi:MAG: hypothetical protein ACI4D6_10785 [Chordicoccus sp.]
MAEDPAAIAAGPSALEINQGSDEVYLQLISTPWKTDEIRTESLLAERFHQFSKGGQAAKPLCPSTTRNAKRSESGDAD